MINKLGLSDTVMKLINSRNRQDRKIVVGGFVFLFVLFWPSCACGGAGKACVCVVVAVRARGPTARRPAPPLPGATSSPRASPPRGRAEFKHHVRGPRGDRRIQTRCAPDLTLGGSAGCALRWGAAPTLASRGAAPVADRGAQKAAQKGSPKRQPKGSPKKHIMAQVAPEVVVTGEVVGPGGGGAGRNPGQVAPPDRGPGDQSGKPGLMALAAAINLPDGAAGTLDMRQHWSALEALTGGAYEKANIYDIHHHVEDKKARFSAESKAVQVVAHSTWCERQCCAPAH